MPMPSTQKKYNFLVWKEKLNRFIYDNKKDHNDPKISQSRYEPGPPDLDQVFQHLIRKINLFKTKKWGITKLSPPIKLHHYISFILFVLFLWIGSGFYTVKEAERGVILRCGKFDHLVHPGLNWKPTFIDNVITVNVESVRELAASGVMLTSDENVVRVEMNVQYRVTEPQSYLFNVTNTEDSLRQATDSALRGVIGKYTMDRILTEGRTVVRSDTQKVLEETIQPYHMGIILLDVNFQAARPPEEVKAAFDDAIAARENEQQYIREAEAYANEVQPSANGKAQRILEEGRAYKTRNILEAQGEIKRFSQVLPVYKCAPEITRERLYIDTMEHFLSHTRKIFIKDKNTPKLLVIPYDRSYISPNTITNTASKNSISHLPHTIDVGNHTTQNNNSSRMHHQRNMNIQRDDLASIERIGRK